MLALVKRRTLARLRKDVEPVEQVAYARFLAEWQGVGSGGRGADAVLSALEQLSGYAMPASAVETVILPARVEGYTPAMLDELTAAGEVRWVGDGPIGDSDGWIRWYVADQEPHPAQVEPSHYRSQELLAALGAGGGYFFDQLLPSGVRAHRPVGLRRRAVGPRLGRPGRRRHVRPRAGADRRRRLRTGARPGRARGPTGRGSPGSALSRPGRPPRISLTGHGRAVVAGAPAVRHRPPSGSRPTSSPSSTATASSPAAAC